MQSKGLCVNVKKTTFLISGIGLDVLKDSGMLPCSVCHSGVGNNSIECMNAHNANYGSINVVVVSMLVPWETCDPS